MPDGKPQWCASDVEAVRLEQLLALQEAGEISDLQCQPRFALVVNNQHITNFRPDFLYRRPNGVDQVEEVKGMIMEDYRLRMLLFKALYPQFHVEVIKPGKKQGSRSIWMDFNWKGRLP